MPVSPPGRAPRRRAGQTPTASLPRGPALTLHSRSAVFPSSSMPAVPSPASIKPLKSHLRQHGSDAHAWGLSPPPRGCSALPFGCGCPHVLWVPIRFLATITSAFQPCDVVIPGLLRVPSVIGDGDAHAGSPCSLVPALRTDVTRREPTRNTLLELVTPSPRARALVCSGICLSCGDRPERTAVKDKYGGFSV